MRNDIPPGACDSHIQVFGPAERFPYATPNPPEDAPEGDLRAYLDGLGLQRAVLVQPTAHGVDNSAMLDALRSQPDRYRGVAVVAADVSGDTIAELHAAGVRALRANFVPILGPSATRETLLHWQALIAPFGWSMVAHLPAGDLGALRSDLDCLDLPIAVDHVGRLNVAADTVKAAFRDLLDLAARPNMWMKLSALDRLSARGSPFDDVAPFVEQLADVAADRLLWGSNWPHPNLNGPAPNEQILLHTLRKALHSEEIFRKVLVDNPGRLYFS